MRSRIVLLLVLAVALGGCGGGDDPDTLTVSAAASLKRPLTGYGEEFTGARVRMSFAGSDDLAAQIRNGLRPDVYAAANTKLPEALFREGLVERPVVFAGNRLVIAVPADSDIRSIDDLTRPGLTLAVGSESVPIGSYTRRVLDRLDARRRDAIVDRIRSNEPDVSGVVGKVSQGAVDAGFVYVTDVAAAGDKLRAVELPTTLQPSVAYGAAVVKDAPNPEAARRFLDGLVEGEGARLLREAGFAQPQ